MDYDSLEYPELVIDFLGKRIRGNVEVFRVVWNNRDDGIKWADLVKAIGDRYVVEKALLVLETVGFVAIGTSINKREKRYVPHAVRGIQLAEFIRDNQQ